MKNNLDNKGRIRCLIIDDDPFIHDLLQDKLSQHFPEVSILSIASSGADGINKINEYNPELIFLDVEMSDMTGFEMLSRINEISFRTIFITSYSHYAIKAIRFNALDYLLKPFDLEELKSAIQRYKQQLISNSTNTLPLAIKNYREPNIADHELVLHTQNGELIMKVGQISHIEGDRNYSIIHLGSGKKELVSKTLSDLEAMLEGKGFFRIHKSHLINKLYIRHSSRNDHIELLNGSLLPISRRRKANFKDWFEGNVG